MMWDATRGQQPTVASQWVSRPQPEVAGADPGAESAPTGASPSQPETLTSLGWTTDPNESYQQVDADAKENVPPPIHNTCMDMPGFATVGGQDNPQTNFAGFGQ